MARILGTRTRILGINGIRSNGSDNTDQLLAKLEEQGHETVDTSYPVTSLFRARPRGLQFSDANLIMNRHHKDGDAVIAHSRGCLVNLRMMELGARFSTVFWFRPAMNIDFLIPRHACKKLYIVHHPSDRAIRMGEYLPWHDFGAAGRLGLHAGNRRHYLHDQRATNVPAPNYELHEPFRHSDDFLPENINTWVQYIDEILEKNKTNGSSQ